MIKCLKHHCLLSCKFCCSGNYSTHGDVYCNDCAV